jgi:hypothetical protein
LVQLAPPLYVGVRQLVIEDEQATRLEMVEEAPERLAIVIAICHRGRTTHTCRSSGACGYVRVPIQAEVLRSRFVPIQHPDALNEAISLNRILAPLH